MAFDQQTRNRLQRFVSDARAVLTEEFTRQLQNDFGLDPVSGQVTSLDSLGHLDPARLDTARVLRETLAHYVATSPSAGNREVLDRIVREQAFTVLNRLAALRMAEARGLLIESVGNGYNSKGFQLYARLAGTGLGETGDAYRQYLFSVFDEFSLDLKVLFDRFSPQGRLFPREAALLQLLQLVNDSEIEHLWAEDETIGWIYQYFNSREERKKMRDESAAPRNSRELAVRNQFFTPRYVVEFLTDNTLGRIWYEMTKGQTALVEKCRYLVRRPNEVFLGPTEAPPEPAENAENPSQEELLNQPVFIQHRPLKDPREIRMIDPACGSMHFGLYAFDVFETIYLEAWDVPVTGLHEAYPGREAYVRDIPRLIIENNIHGVDIDPRAVQIAGLSLWLRAQRSWQAAGVKAKDRPRIGRSNIVCAEPMPGEADFLKEFREQHFSETPELRLLGQLVERIFEAMKLAGEAGSLLKIETEIADAVAEAKRKWKARPNAVQVALFEKDLPKSEQLNLGFDVTGITDAGFWEQAESSIYEALRDYAETVEGGNYQRRLFAQDAARGFAFIDMCRKEYDVALMNPPFGEGSTKAKSYLVKQFPRTKNDV
ncbi:MAG TPA: SAM-dependent methyltransferase, partial [Acidobacteriota bacterium]|nr:SAM-dependent methyltransferase [Acidobacteriota bacterium]